jgi:hypothetical protein
MPPKPKSQPKKQNSNGKESVSASDQGGHKGTKGLFDMNKILSGSGGGSNNTRKNK